MVPVTPTIVSELPLSVHSLISTIYPLLYPLPIFLFSVLSVCYPTSPAVHSIFLAQSEFLVPGAPMVLSVVSRSQLSSVVGVEIRTYVRQIKAEKTVETAQSPGLHTTFSVPVLSLHTNTNPVSTLQTLTLEKVPSVFLQDVKTLPVK